MAEKEQTGERTEKATPRRLERAREAGHVPRSGELSAVVVLLASCVLLAALGPALMRQLTRMTAAMLRDAGDVSFQAGSLRAGALGEAAPAAITACAILVGLCAAALLAGVAQVGLRAVSDRCRIDLGRLSVVDGLKRMFSRRGCIRAAMSVCKLLAVAAIGLTAIRSLVPRIAAVAATSPKEMAGAAGTMLGAVAVKVAVALLVLATIDYLYQRWEHRQDLKMTRQEHKDEMKESEGDVATRARRRRRQSAGQAVDSVREI